MFICQGTSCCVKFAPPIDADSPLASSEDLWQHLKSTTAWLFKDFGVIVHRSQSPCLRVCASGPIVVVYPGPWWYYETRTSRDIDALIGFQLSQRVGREIDREKWLKIAHRIGWNPSQSQREIDMRIP